MALTKYVKMGIKRYLDNSLAYLPDSGEMLKNIYRRLRYEKRKSVLKVKLLFTKYHIPDPETIYWIDPERIVFHSNYNKGGNPDFKDRVFDMIKDKGRVYGGAWDVSPYKFSDLDVYKAFEQRIRYGMEWEETEFYKNELTQIETGRKLWGCENRIDWDERCRYLDLLIQSIREQGYKLAHQVSVSGRKVGHFLLKEMSEEVTVNIGRNGQYLFQDGRHRLSIAKILAVKRIPVKILVRHKKWQELREKLIFMAKGSGSATGKQGVLCQPGNHLDLSDIPAAHSCEDHFLAVKDHR